MNTHTNSVVIITGASAGIGQGAALEIAKQGVGLIVTYRTHPEGAHDTVARIGDIGGKAVALPLDVADSSTFARFTDEVRERLQSEWSIGAIQGLVNNAGFGGGNLFADMTEDAFDRYYRVLLRGPYFLTQALLPLLADGASIVNVSSSSAQPGDTHEGYSGYAAMKAGLSTATRYLAKELAPRGIRVNAVSPGPTRTRLGDDAFEKYPEIIDGLAARTVLGRIGEPEDIGKVIAFLLSGQGAWITGEDIRVTGGYAL